MILLTSTSDLVQVITGSTSVVHVQASYVDLNAGTVTPGRTNTSISSAATTTVVGSPGSSTQRTVKFLSIQNTGASEAVTVQHTDGSTPVKLQTLTLAAGYTLVYNEGSGWTLYDASGNIQTAIGPGRFVGQQLIAAGTTTVTASPGVAKWRIRMVAGGGQGAGAPATTGENGPGGGAGGYAEWVVAVVAGTVYNCVVGAGGSTGGTGANGQTGADTTLTVGGTTVTCKGGVGGVASASITIPTLGGAGGAISTNGTLNAGGESGEANVCTGTAANNRSGRGGSSQFGAGGGAQLNASNATGLAAVGFGAGGGGATTTGTAHAGGAGGAGLITIDELSG